MQSEGTAIRKELFISHKYSRFVAPGVIFFYFCFLPFTEFALKIYTSLFKNQTRSAKKKKNQKQKPIQNPEKRPEREVRHSRTSA